MVSSLNFKNERKLIFIIVKKNLLSIRTFSACHNKHTMPANFYRQNAF
jgi:hypothetical protein